MFNSLKKALNFFDPKPKKIPFIPPTIIVPPRDFNIRIPLLRIPDLALREILRCLDPVELSRRCRHQRGFHLISPVTHKTDDDYNPNCFQVPSLERCVIEYNFNDNFVWFVYPENDLENFATIVHHLQNIFKCPITSFKYFRVVDKTWFQMFKSIMEYQTTPLDYMTLSVNIKKEELEWVTEHIKVTDYLELITNGAKPFEMDFTTDCKKLFVRSTFLIDTRNLLRLKSCSSFKLMDSQLTLKDLDLFMRKWVEGCYPNLVYMSIDSQGFRDNHQIYGFLRQDIGLINGRERRGNINHPNHSECFGGVEIRANDGTRAIMQMSEEDVFKLFVMKD